ncbi:uroporphyrinogen-III C-methyltransferase [Legionella impletisoli]|uniref:Uroporphyrinogen-III C-methyltransferase n=1 Tax=Legionella impletisoli TaxID=343510 RepID=A0A917NCI8_9GAMM|nr:uroporphyrinogen-III C-methyltransferase [Legionella impletisoli]GGI89212.1 hypothetical protein GCM10007966_17440 [Legionella impletisoli]
MATSEKPNTTKRSISTTSSEEKSTTSPNHTLGTKPTFIAFILVIALIAMAFALFATYNNLQLQRQIAFTADQINTEINSLSESHTSVQERINTTLESFAESSNQLGIKLKTLDKNMQSALKQQHYNSDDWLLLKARYYLQLAQINAHWSNNVETTIALLQQADELLANIHDQRLFEVRQAIAKEITQLKSLQSLDKTGLLSKLDALQETVSNLPIKTSVTPENRQNNNEATTKTPEAWRDRLKNSINLLERLVVIRRHDEAIQPLLSQQQEALLRASLQLNLQEAQWAVLQNNETVYKMALNQAIQTIQRYFTTEKGRVEGVLNQLQTLKATNLTEPKPDLNRSLTLLNQIIDARNSKSIEATKTGENS